MRFLHLIFVLLLFLILSSLATAMPQDDSANRQISPTKKPSVQTLIFILERAAVFEVFLSAIRETGWEEKLKKNDIYTIFAPSDAAFAHVGSFPRDQLFANKNLLKKFVEQHIVPGRVAQLEMKNLNSINSVSGAVLPIEQKAPMEIGHAGILQSDISAENGLVHMLSRATLLE